MLAHLDRGLVTVTGEDAGSFLQSLLSQDLDPLHDGDGAHALLLAPQGKLVADLRVLRVNEHTWWLDCERSVAPALAEGLNRFRIRVKAEVADRSDGFAAGAVRGATHAPLAVDVPREPFSHTAWRDARVVRADWPGQPGFDVIGPAPTVAAALDALGDDVVSGDEYERARIEAGVVRQGHDVDERTIPQEAFLEQTAVSFTKGCFVGQELVCRIDTRGHVNRYLRRARLDAAAPRGAQLELDGKTVGEITSTAGTVALAMVRREIEPPAEVDVVWDGGRARAQLEVL